MAIIFISGAPSAARWVVLLPGAAHASMTYSSGFRITPTCYSYLPLLIFFPCVWSLLSFFLLVLPTKVFCFVLVLVFAFAAVLLIRITSTASSKTQAGRHEALSCKMSCPPFTAGWACRSVFGGKTSNDGTTLSIVKSGKIFTALLLFFFLVLF